VGRGHVDARSQHASAVGELTGAHALEEVEVLVDGRPRQGLSRPASVNVPRCSRISSADWSST
jgi:hypothetical protein